MPQKPIGQKKKVPDQAELIRQSLTRECSKDVEEFGRQLAGVIAQNGAPITIESRDKLATEAIDTTRGSLPRIAKCVDEALAKGRSI